MGKYTLPRKSAYILKNVYYHNTFQWILD